MCLGGSSRFSLERDRPISSAELLQVVKTLMYGEPCSTMPATERKPARVWERG